MTARIFAFFIFSLICTFQSKAKCTIQNGALIGSFITLNFPELVIQKDIPVGTVLAKVDANIAMHASAIGVPATSDFISCSPGTLRFAEPSYNKTTYNGSQVLESGIPGIAIKVSNYGGTGKLPWSFPPGMTLSFTGSLSPHDYGGVTFELIKISSTTGSGTIPSGNLLRFSSFNQYYLFNYRLTSSRITTVSCSVLTPTIEVGFGDVEKRAFSGVGTTVSERTFEIITNCDSGAIVNISMNGTVNPDLNDDAILSLQNYGDSSVADGVGIQILQGANPVKLNSSILLKQSTGGVEKFPFKARYYQTKDNIGPGKANAVLTFSVTYN